MLSLSRRDVRRWRRAVVERRRRRTVVERRWMRAVVESWMRREAVVESGVRARMHAYNG